MVHEARLISSMMIVIPSTAIIILSVCQVCLTQDDINRNLVRDNLELGNAYSRINSRGTNYDGAQKRKHPNYHRRTVPANHHNFHVPSASNSNEEEPSYIANRNALHTKNLSVEINNHLTRNGTNSTGTANQPSVPGLESGEETCPMCSAARKNSNLIASLDEETLRAVRVEIVKKQILEKLRLKEPPKMKNIPKGHNTVIPPIALGNPELDNNIRSDQDDDVANLDLEDFYGKTEQIIVLPQDELRECASWGNPTRSEAASCFLFNLPQEVIATQISSAELWVYKLADSTKDDNLNGEGKHNFSSSEVTYHYSRVGRKPEHRFHPISTRENIPDSAGWINFNITDRARKWIVTEAKEHTIKVSCSTCNRDPHESPFDNVDEQQPFIVFNIANGKRKRRHRRSVNCTPGLKECCRESLYISFEEMKWDWVLEPKGFDAYYCKGSCHGDTALASMATRHSALMNDYVKLQGGVNNKTVELVPCCTATEMSPISMIYRVQEYNTTFNHVKLPNMVVKSCGCK